MVAITSTFLKHLNQTSLVPAYSKTQSRGHTVITRIPKGTLSYTTEILQDSFDLKKLTLCSQGVEPFIRKSLISKAKGVSPQATGWNHFIPARARKVEVQHRLICGSQLTPLGWQCYTPAGSPRPWAGSNSGPKANGMAESQRERLCPGNEAEV